ncbi:MAG: hypothetical protein HFI90_08315 [Clostridia bacterium]|nr:hypothetical protein [Clostridia bacterium]
MKKLVSLLLCTALAAGGAAGFGYGRERNVVIAADTENTSFVTLPETGVTVETNPTGYAYQSPYNEETTLDFTDPQYMSDEAFFGAWGGEKWTTAPKLDYENYMGLSQVESYAMVGDYESAKSALLQYYQERELQYARPTIGANNKKEILTAQLLKHNYTYNENSNAQLIDIATVESHEYNEQQPVEVDVTSFVKTVLDSTTTVMPLYLTARNKDGAQISILSKEYGEGNLGARISVVSNGVTTDYEVKEDAMIAGGYGKNASYNYKGATELLLEESLSSVNTRTPKEEGAGQPTTFPVDENTRRVHLKFDLAGAGASSDVASATLKLYAKINDKENHVDRKDMVLFVTKNTDWSEDTVSFNSTNQYIFSYEHEPSLRWHRPWLGAAGHRYTDELYRFNTYLKHPIGQYNYTTEDKEEYAYTALRQWAEFIRWNGSSAVAPQKHWAEGNGDEVIDSYLGVACRNQFMPQALFALIHSKHMTPDLLTASMKYLTLTADYSYNRTPNKNNIGAQEISGLYNVGLCFREMKRDSVWQERAISRLPSYTQGYMMNDGTIKEVALGYVDYALNGIWSVQDYAEQMDERVEYSDEVKAVMKTMAYYLMHASGPGGREIQQGDAYGYSSTGVKNQLKIIAELTDDPYIWYVATDGQRGLEPEDTSAMYADGKKYTMRSDWNKAAVFLQTNADNAYESHGHKDDLSIILWGYDQYLLADPLYSSYQGGTASTWLTGTMGHNTVVVNNASQSASGKTDNQGITNKWEANDIYDFADITTKNYSGQGVSHSRKILFVRPGYFLVFDHMKPSNDTAKNYKQYWHFLPDADISMNEETGVVRTNFPRANVQIATAMKGGITPTLREDGYYGLGHSGVINNVKYAYYEQNATEAATYETLIYPEEVGKRGLVQTKAEEIPLTGVAAGAASAMQYVIDDRADGEKTEGTAYLVHESSAQTGRMVGDYVTDASLLHVSHKAGKLSEITFSGGKTLTAPDGAAYISAPQTVSDLGVRYGTSTLELATTAEVEREGLTIYAPKAITTVTWNGEEVNIQRSGNYIYFGATPSVADTSKTPESEDGSTPVKTPEPAPTLPSHGGGGGGGGAAVAPKPTPTPENTLTPTPIVTPQPTVTPDNRESGTLSEGMKAELEGHWAQKEISEMVEKGIVKGVSADSLGLGNATTRAEFAAMLVRALGLPETPQQGAFSDVPTDAWYAGALAAAKEAGILQGADGKANPEDNISREEMAKMLAAVCAGRGIEAAGEMKAFTDSGTVSEWARQGVTDSVKMGLMNGMEDGSFAPKEAALREQTIVVLERLLQLLENTSK